ncbi:MAG: hypothetical protein A7315_11025 [Candidatus Altiarchaeales archaeon WOR_SM1_79]|nr:MAG: hypothetical protein A7315_11025 [Candidatus Altiarchaeales archaeon WOR_SM1_79]
MAKTIEEINQKIKDGDALVLTAEEMIGFVREKGVKKASDEVDVVTTGTFGAMCSSGAFLNFGHSDPPMKLQKIRLNNVEAYGGLAAVDVYIGASQPSEKDPNYGGAHVIEDLVNKRDISVKAESLGTDCYPKKRLETIITIDDLNQAVLLNPRNAYQNYAAATNSTDRVLHTYMGTLLPRFGNVTYSSAGQLSPLINDPYLKTIGLGTRIFLGGAEGYVIGEGTQHNTGVERKDNIPISPAGTIMVRGDLKKMNSEFLRAATFHGYGYSLYVGIGIPIPILNEGIAKHTSIADEDIVTKILDYGVAYRNRPMVREVSYKELRSGAVEIEGEDVPTSSLSSYKKARDVACELKRRIKKGKFILTSAVEKLPKSEFHGMKEIKRAVLVADLMRKPVVCGIDDTIEQTSRLMIEKAINHIPIVEEDKLVGIVTSWDVAKAVAKKKEELKDVMIRDVVTAHPEDVVEDAARKLSTHGISALPVIDGNKKLIGIITSEDISKLMTR